MKPLQKKRLTEEDGRRALSDHVVSIALAARDRYGDRIDYETFLRLLEDREVVRYPTRVEFDAGFLEPGEFAHAQALGEGPGEGFCVFVHPRYRDRPEVLPLLVAYHLVNVNYGEIATREEAELFGATLLGLDVDDYYGSLCLLADELLTDPGSCGAG